MRAAVVERYGPPEVVEVRHQPDPAPGRRQVVVRVLAAAVTSGDARVRGANFPPGFDLPARLAFGLRRPRHPILGGTLSGEVVAVGSEVRGLSVGDRVCGMNGAAMGAHAELVAVDARRLARVPASVSHQDAAGVLFGGTTAWHFLHGKAGLSPGATVLVNGASGAIGTNAVQLARLRGATVTAVTSGRNADLVRSLGAERIVDHTLVDVADLADRYDVVLDAVGNLSARTGRRLLREGGVLALAVAGLGDTVRARGPVVAGPAPERAEVFDSLLELVADGSLAVVVERTYDLDGIVDAHRLVDGGHKVGNVLVLPGP